MSRFHVGHDTLERTLFTIVRVKEHADFVLVLIEGIIHVGE